MSVVWAFPGQGSHRRGMGDGLLERHPDLCARADEILGYSIAELCRDVRRLRDTRYVQPALYTVDALTYLARTEDDGERPDYLAGHSLGEYAALFAAGCFDFETGLRLVMRRGELMGEASGGTMSAVLGVPRERLEELLAGTGVDVANDNSPEQVVVAGPKEEIQAVSQVITEAGGKCVPLNVRTAFHSRYMKDAAEAFRRTLESVEYAEPRVPVIANVTGRPHVAGDIAESLRRQIDSPVRWLDGLRYLMRQGVDRLEEIGPGDVLTKLWQVTRKYPVPDEPAQVPGAASPDVPTRAASPAPVAAAVPAQRPAPARGAEPSRASGTDLAARLGSPEFRADYGLRHAYLAGSMFKGIASTDLVVRMGKAGLMGFFGAGGLKLAEIEDAIQAIRRGLGTGEGFGMNLLYGFDENGLERDTVELYLKHDVRHVEAAAYPHVTAPLVRYRFTGAHRDSRGRPVAVRHVLAKVSRPEVATAFMSPPPEPVLRRLVERGELTPDEAEAAASLPVSQDVCVEADSAGHTDGRSPYGLMPAMLELRDRANRTHGYAGPIRVGASGGLGAPEAVAAAFVLGADFVVTGSVNQCSVEAGTSDEVKDMLAGLDVQDTTYAPAGDMFELGARVQVARKGTLFPARANKLYQLYRNHGGLDDLDPATARTVQDKYFRRSFAEVWDETAAYLAANKPGELDRAEANPRHKMALVFRWYFVHSIRLALSGTPGRRVDYQIHCGPAMGSFNHYARTIGLADRRDRHVDLIADHLMTDAAAVLHSRLRHLSAR
ncbi:ACP S-malonyltransferase [Sphaerisporangium rubeum]|uniref:[acyl-carrier-protein] S-malonyltransferase n=1 Tax=Sphaerisporangium rubeum TaxID=321317 RepID=A0A7X0M8C6_9ACTN|nr:ACP S-malonyltransferase [Sphaerisporangium rubeum]MBB6475698.1 trans-AT polyketide synthase/acyltransferase/oxidoreductase domain-containing protein [Sphaerisporangium rubeum]